MAPYIIEYRNKGERDWQPLVTPPVLPGWTARKAEFTELRAADDACYDLKRRAGAAVEYRVLYINRRRALEGSSARWRRKLSEMPLEQHEIELREKLAALDEKREDLMARLEDVMSMTGAKCLSNNYGKGCGKTSAIRDLIFIQTHWYVQPSGCSDGDYWRQGEGQFECPHCGHRNRLYDRPDLAKLKALFRGVVEEHDDR